MADERSMEERMRDALRKRGLDPDVVPALRREYDPALVPTMDLLGERRLDPELDKLKDQIDRLTIFDIYDKFMPSYKHRAHPKPGQRESILFSCPAPEHPDEHPSAWTNLDGLWYCGGCEARGDKFTVAALGLGLDTKRDFRTVTTRIADAFGIPYDLTPTLDEFKPKVRKAEPPPRSDVDDRATTAVHADAPPDLHVFDRVPDDARELFTAPMPAPTIKWELIYPPDSFVYFMMKSIEYDDVPYEYVHFQSLQAVGLAVGRDVVLVDIPTVIGNSFMVLYGPTGGGKSRSMYYVQKVLQEALPYDYSDPYSKGVAMIPLPGSPEALVDSFSAPIMDGDGKIVGYGSVRGYVRSDEFGTVLAKGDRSSGLKFQMTEMFDRAEVKIKSRGSGTVEAQGIFCSFITSTQPAAVAEIVKHADVVSGYLNRFIPVSPNHRSLLAMRTHEFNPSDAIRELQRIRTWASTGIKMRMDEGANRLWEQFFHDELMPIKLDVNVPIMTRIDLTLKKIMLWIAVNEHRTHLDRSVVERAIMFFDYLKYSYGELVGGITLHRDEEMIEWITSSIKRFVDRTGKPPTGRDLRHLMPKRYTVRNLNEGLGALEKLGQVRRVTVGPSIEGGRPTTRFVLSELVIDD